jgi:integrase
VAYDPNEVVAWLTANSSLSKSHLNTMRSSVASVYAVVHKNKTPLAEDQAVTAFFKARKRQQEVMPTKMDAIWDIKIMVDYLKTWGANEELDLQHLQDKTIILLCIATLWRPRSDIGRLRWQDLEWIWDKEHSSQLAGVRILARHPKEGIQKYSTLATIPTQTSMCPVTTLFCFITRTTQQRHHLAADHTLFLSYIHHATKQPQSMDDKTVSERIKAIMAAAGIDTTIFTPHSIRSAASSAAYHKGIEREHIKKHANWSLTSDTFERYYLKNNKLLQSRGLLNTLILDHAENDTTSGVEAEASTIVLGTPHN